MSLGLDWPRAEETRRMHSQEGNRVEPTGEAQERQTPAHLEADKNGRFGRETAPVAESEAHCYRVRWRALVDDLCSIRNKEDCVSE